MKRHWLSWRVVTLGCACASATLAGLLFTDVPARAAIDVQIIIGNAPPPPHFMFRQRPRERYYSDDRIYVIEDPGVGDNDCFRYAGYYWVFNDGYWYRSPSWRGHFRVVEPRYVPAAFYRMPAARWKHQPSGPPGQVRRGEGGDRREGPGNNGQGNNGRGNNGRGNEGRGNEGHGNKGRGK